MRKSLYTLTLAASCLGSSTISAALTAPAGAVLGGEAPLVACQSDGATLLAAVSYFKILNPGQVVTEAKLLSKASTGGPFLQMWSNNPYFVFTLGGGVLEIRSSDPQLKAVPYTGPESCVQADISPNWFGAHPGLVVQQNCESNAAAVASAVSAYKRHNRGRLVTKSALLSHTHGGPFLRAWPQSIYYALGVTTSGSVQIKAVTAGAKVITFVAGGSSCVLARVW